MPGDFDDAPQILKEYLASGRTKGHREAETHDQIVSVIEYIRLSHGQFCSMLAGIVVASNRSLADFRIPKVIGYVRRHG